jgi:hypothetical protein
MKTTLQTELSIAASCEGLDTYESRGCNLEEVRFS